MAAVSFVALHDHGGAKVTKSRTRSSVKPILRKLHSSSCSEKNSLDLDRGWDEQTSPHLGNGAPTLDDYYYSSYNSYNSANSTTTTTTATNTGTSSTATTTPADLTGPGGTLLSSSSAIIIPASPLATPALTQASSASTSIDSPATAASHIRSTSGASQFSIATSTASAGSPRHGHGGGSFVHPFQQTPRTSTPPLLSYAHARASLDTLSSSHGTGSLASSSHATSAAAAAAVSPRDAPTTIDEKDEELEPLPRPLVTSATATSLRPSLDMHHFRLRARSDVDTATRQEQVRAARRKFEEKERAKQEKYAREQTRKQQQQQHGGHHKSRKGSWPTRSSTSEARPAGGAALPRRSTAHEKTELEASNGLFSHERAEDDAAQQTDDRPATARANASKGPTDMSDVHFAHSTRRRDAKRKTTGAWTAFVLWFRTRLLKLGRR